MASEMRCQACNVPTDNWVDVQGPKIPDHPQGYSEYRRAVICIACLDAVDADMWISKRCWESLNPQTPYEELPVLK